MVKKYVFASVVLVIVGVVLGAVMVSSFGNGVDLGLAYGGDDVRSWAGLLLSRRRMRRSRR